MAENPLLPHRKLQELYRLMERCRTLEKKQRTPFAREAILAATTIHLEPGDYISSTSTDRTLTTLAPANYEGDATEIEPFATKSPRLVLATATALGQQLTGKSLTLACASAHTSESSWAEALTLAQAHRLPVVFCVSDAPPKRTSTKAGALTWPAADKLCRRLQLPTLSVDGEDAVAVYRVMQEAALRARTGLGPSVIWALLSPAGTALKRSETPIARLQRYLAARNIALPRGTTVATQPVN